MNQSLPTVDELLGGLIVVSLRMRVRFRGLDSRDVALVHGPAGWGEFGAFPEYDDSEAAQWLASAVEMAWQGPPPPLRDRVAVNATVPAVEPGEVAEVLDRFPGCGTVKVKVAERGQGPRDDLDRVDAVLDTRPGAGIRVDANGGWSVTEAHRAVLDLDTLVRDRTGEGLEYVEQPCRSVDELVAVRSLLAATGRPVPVAADESIRRAEDPFHVVRAGGADRAVVKAAPLGGPRRLLDVAARLGVPVTVSSALDSAVGMSAGIAAAAALPAGVGGVAAAGLGTGGFFVEDVVDPARAPRLVDGSLPAGPVDPDPGRLGDLAASGDLRRWWVDRIRRCHAVLDRR